ncbi:MAG TPA: hypothetical protein VJ829_06240 [Candidatus Binatia bacterium]|nr:hypothetical protein [Candidatus Binatia bacterium]
MVCLVLEHLGRIALLRAVPPVAFLVAALALGTYGWARSGFRIDDHGSSRTYLTGVLRSVDVEVASQPAGATVFLENGKPSPRLLGPVLVGAPQVFPGRAAAFLLVHGEDELDGRRVRFVERDRTVIDWCARFPETPLAHLLVPPDAVSHP